MMKGLNKIRIRKISDEEPDVQEGVIDLLQELIDDKTNKLTESQRKEIKKEILRTKIDSLLKKVKD